MKNHANSACHANSENFWKNFAISVDFAISVFLRSCNFQIFKIFVPAISQHKPANFNPKFHPMSLQHTRILKRNQNHNNCTQIIQTPVLLKNLQMGHRSKTECLLHVGYDSCSFSNYNQGRTISTHKSKL
jgi:hypothetical protein